MTLTEISKEMLKVKKRIKEIEHHIMITHRALEIRDLDDDYHYSIEIKIKSREEIDVSYNKLKKGLFFNNQGFPNLHNFGDFDSCCEYPSNKNSAYEIVKGKSVLEVAKSIACVKQAVNEAISLRDEFCSVRRD